MASSIQECDRVDSLHGQPQRTTQSHRGNNGNYHSALMLIFLLGSAAVALAFVPVLIPSSHESEKISTNARNITQPIHALCTVMMSALCIYFIIKLKTWKDSGEVQFMPRHSRNTVDRPNMYNFTESLVRNSTEARAEDLHAMPFKQSVMFGVGAGMWLTCDMVYIICFGDQFGDNSVYWNWVSLLDVFIYLLSVVIQIIFLAKYDGAILPNNCLFHYSIALMIADKVWVWITVTLGGIDDVMSHAHNHTDRNSTAGNVTESTFQTALDMTLVFLDPFFLEFLTISMGLLFHMWNLIGKDRAVSRTRDSRSTTDVRRHSDGGYGDYSYVIESEGGGNQVSRYYGSDVTESEQCGLLGYNTNRNIRLHLNDKIKTCLFTVFVIVVHLGLFTLDLVIYQLRPFLSWSNSLPISTQYILNYGIQIAAFLPITFACIVATYKIYKENTYWSLRFTSSDYLLFCTSAANFIWLLFRVIAATTILSTSTNADQRNQAIIVLCYAILRIIQVWVQTQMLLAARSVHQMGRPNSKLTRFCLIYLVVINIWQWLAIAISRELLAHRTPFTTVMIDCFGEATTTTLMYFFYLAIELYCFHSAVVAYETLK
ncbi:uncharacterized protein [Amphiura filiformis]|uniref:uncharacterized protein n=1 Tax=Amphiura filiformis TaxID=82378 RepID=UPI003B20E3B7